VDNDALDSMDQFKRAVIAVLQRLRGLALAAIQDRVGGRDARGGCGIFRTHDAGQDIDRRAAVAPRQRANFGEGFGHLDFSVIAFSSEVDAGSRKENALKRETRARF
jgi:hypothetical protein